MQQLLPVVIGRLIIFLFLFSAQTIFAKGEEETSYDEIAVYVNVQGVGSTEVPAIIRGQVLYLPITDLFSFLKIKNLPTANLDSVTGFFINTDAVFVIDGVSNKIEYAQNTFEIKPGDLIKTESNLYLKSEYFGTVFGLDCIFNFRSLSVTMTTKLELPVVREMRLEMMRKNINRLKGEITADTVVKPVYKLFNFGMVDWSVVSTHQTRGSGQTLLNLSIGSVIAGGETNISINYNSAQEFKEKQQFYLWRFANNDHKALRQILLGKILPQATSSIFAPIVGGQITNAPTTFRRSFGSYTLSNTTQPGWIVELYVNNVLVDYTKADASGFYSFKVPLVYGNSQVKLRFYGPWGEELSHLENLSVPFNFLPQGELQYAVSAGIVEDDQHSKFSRGIINYGLGKRITIGSGIEYLSSISSGNTMPFIAASMRLGNRTLFSGEYTYGVRTRGILNYRLPSDLQIELNYSNYQKGQQAISNSFLEERKLIVSTPYRHKKLSVFSRLTVDQFILSSSRYTTAEWLISGAIFDVGTNFSTYGSFTENANPYLYSNLSMAFRLSKGFLFTPQIQYEYNSSRFFSMKFALEKHVFKNGYLNFSYEQNFKSNLKSLALDLRYDFSFAQIGLSARQLNNTTSILQMARGSLMFDPQTNYAGGNNRNGVGRGGIVMMPFLDLNNNGKKDEDEPKILGPDVHINGGRVEISKKDTCIRIFDLEPYISYLIELNPDAFENIGWQLKKKTWSIFVDPNQFKAIAVPISVVAEISGNIFLKNANGTKAQGQVIVCFYDIVGTLVGRVLSESDGYFDFIGLAPGNYIVRIDTSQLRKLRMITVPEMYPVTINKNRDGDVIDNLVFTLQTADTIKNEDTVSTQKIDTSLKKNIKKHTGYAIQMAAFRKKENALKLQKQLTKIYKKPLYIVYRKGYYKVRFAGFKNYKSAQKFKSSRRFKNSSAGIIVKLQ